MNLTLARAGQPRRAISVCAGPSALSNSTGRVCSRHRLNASPYARNPARGWKREQQQRALPPTSEIVVADKARGGRGEKGDPLRGAGELRRVPARSHHSKHCRPLSGSTNGLQGARQRVEESSKRSGLAARGEIGNGNRTLARLGFTRLF